MTILDPRAVAYWPLNEQWDSVLPVDQVGSLADLTVPAGLTRPAAVQIPGGYGRDFVRSSLTGLYASDAASKLLLTRAVTIVALARLDVSALANGNVCVLVQRGRGGANPITFGLASDYDNTANTVTSGPTTNNNQTTGLFQDIFWWSINNGAPRVGSADYINAGNSLILDNNHAVTGSGP